MHGAFAVVQELPGYDALAGVPGSLYELDGHLLVGVPVDGQLDET